MSHPASQSSVPTTLTAQMPKPTVQATPFKASRQVQVKSVEGLSFRAYNKFQDKVDALGFIPISKQEQFVPIVSMLKQPRTLAPPSPVIEDVFRTDVPDVGAIEADAMEGEGVKKMKKGSPAMKAHMARLRAMRKKK